MNRRLVMGISPFVLLAIASCGSSSGSSANNNGNGNGEDGGSSGGDDTTSSSSGGTSSGTASSSGSGASSGGASSGGGDAATGGGSDGGGSEAGTTAQSADVPMLHKHINRDGFFNDRASTEKTLMGTTLKIDTTFAGTVTGNIYASPLYVENGVGGKGTFYVVTESNNVYALDETTGASSVASKSAGTPAGSTGCGASNIKPLGITGTPAIDLASRTIVFDSATAASANGPLAKHTIYAWSIDDFSQKWAFDVTTLKDPSNVAFATTLQNQRSAVLIVNGIAYVTYAGHYGDCGAYRGWVVGIPLASTQANVASQVKTYVVPASQSGMWAPGGPSSDGTSIFVATGNGDNGATWQGAFSVIRLGAGPTFTAGTTNYWHAVMDTGDEDLGGSGPLVVDSPAITPSKLLVQLGKDNNAYVVDRTTMGGEMSPLSTLKASTGEISNAAAWATTSTATYVAMVSNGGSAAANCKKGSGNLGIVAIDSTAQITVPWCANAGGNGSPSITSSDGTNDMLVWTVATEGNGQIHAWDLESGTEVVTGSDALSGTRHFTTPIFVHGRAFAVGDGRLYALKP
jgi:hypothetical protein